MTTTIIKAAYYSKRAIYTSPAIYKIHTGIQCQHDLKDMCEHFIDFYFFRKLLRKYRIMNFTK